MILKNNIKGKNNGFTIVELLVVIVVIGILAAITTVSYTGISTKAKAAQAQSNANSIQQVAEAYNAEAGYYPKTLVAFNAGYGASPSTIKPSAITLIAGQSGSGPVSVPGTAFGTPAIDPVLTASATPNGPSTVSWACQATTTSIPCSSIEPKGGRIEYWDYNNNARAVIYVGTAVDGSTFSITSL